MGSAVLLDPRTGRPEPDAPLDPFGRIELANELAGWVRADPVDVLSPEQHAAALGRAPSSVLELMAKGREEEALRDRGRLEGFYAPPRRASMQSWQECIYVLAADGTAVTAAAETILVPDFTLPANFFNYPGKTVRYTLWGRVSTVITTPGTITNRLRYGGVGGTALAASGAYAPDPTAASTNLTWWIEYVVQCRTVGATGTVMCVGRLFLNDVDDASTATIVANNAMSVIPVSAPATATINTTTANALSPTWTQSVATGSVTVHVATLEALN